MQNAEVRLSPSGVLPVSNASIQAHSIKSASLSIAAECITKEAHAIENAAKKGALDTVDIKKLASEFDRFKEVAQPLPGKETPPSSSRH